VVVEVAEAKLYITIINGQRYFYINYFDSQAGKTKHVYVGSPYLVLKHLDRLKRVANYWNMLDPSSKDIILEALAEIDKAVGELKSLLKS
jgi:hypothetical protein